MIPDDKNFFDQDIFLGVVVDSGGNEFQTGDAVFWCPTWENLQRKNTDWAYVLNNMNKFQKYFQTGSNIGNVEIATMKGRKFVPRYQLKYANAQSYVEFFKRHSVKLRILDALTLVAEYLVDDKYTTRNICFFNEEYRPQVIDAFGKSVPAPPIELIMTADTFIDKEVIGTFDRPKAVTLVFSKELIFDLSNLQTTHPRWPGRFTFANEKWQDKKEKMVLVISQLASLFQTRVKYKTKPFPELEDLPTRSRILSFT